MRITVNRIVDIDKTVAGAVRNILMQKQDVNV